MRQDEEGLQRYLVRHRPGRKLVGLADLATVSNAWRIIAPSGDRYRGMVRTWYADGLFVTRCHGDETIWQRDGTHLGDPFDKFVILVLIHAGDLRSTQRGHQAFAGKGDVLTLVPAEPFESHNTEKTDATLIHIPRAYLEARGVDTNQLAATTWSRTSMADALRELVARTLSIDGEEGDTLGQYLERAILELSTGLLTIYQRGDRNERDLAGSTRERVRRLVDEHFNDPALNADWIAARIGVSRRYIYAVFEGHSITPAAMVRTRRLQHAEYLLRQPDTAAYSLARVARESGFRGPDQLGRAFKDWTGTSPSAYRRRYQNPPVS